MAKNRAPNPSTRGISLWDCLVIALLVSIFLTLCGCQGETTPDNPTHQLGHQATPSLECLDGFVVCLGGGDAQCTQASSPGPRACLARYERCIRGMTCTQDDAIGCFEDWPADLQAQGVPTNWCDL
jgi:hypothetical protein